jgi:hypothetical protein
MCRCLIWKMLPVAECHQSMLRHAADILSLACMLKAEHDGGQR